MNRIIITSLSLLFASSSLGSKKAIDAFLKRDSSSVSSNINTTAKTIGMPGYSSMTEEWWYEIQSNRLASITISEKTPRLVLKSYEDSRSESYVHVASGDDGLLFFNTNNWCYLVTSSFHYSVDGVLLVDNKGNMFTIQEHPCKYLAVFSKDHKRIDSVGALLETTSRSGKKWKKYDGSKRVDPTVKMPVESGSEQGTDAGHP